MKLISGRKNDLDDQLSILEIDIGIGKFYINTPLFTTTYGR
jgi:hypothetical protein